MTKEKLIDFLEKVISIPRASGDEKAISDYILAFARERGYEARQDGLYNLKIRVPAVGCSGGKPVMLQGHMDMVYVKTQDSGHVYKNGIKCVIDGDRMRASEKTSLGADNGAALAYCLAIMDSGDIVHPPLEIVLTVQEEVGLTGAAKLDCDDLKAKYLINLDSENEGEFFTSCSGGVRDYYKIPVKRCAREGLYRMRISVSGLKGGHSGTDIGLGGGNAILLLGRTLREIDDGGMALASFSAEGKANSIPVYASAVIGVPQEKFGLYAERITKTGAMFQNELQYSDKAEVTISEADDGISYYSDDSKKRLLASLELLPCGVMGKSFAIEGMTETSANIGAAEESDNTIKLLSSIRSSVASRKAEVLHKISTIAALTGCASETFNDYPQWNYNPNSPLRDLAMSAYKEMFHKDGRAASIHGGLECAYFDSRLKGVDIISMGCNLYDVHTPKEQVSLESFQHVWLLLTDILAKLAEKEN